MLKTIQNGFIQLRFIPFMLASLIFLSACGSDGSNTAAQQSDGNPSFNLDLPKSLTGGTLDTGSLSSAKAVSTTMAKVNIMKSASSGTGVPCAFRGSDDEDFLENGYRMTQFMVSAIASSTCIADELINLASFVPHNGTIQETENDTLAENYDSDEPTHYSVTDDSDTQVTIRLYYAYDRATPPLLSDDPQFFVSWNRGHSGEIEGRLIIDTSAINVDDRKSDDPVIVRIDFHEDASEKKADMFLRFDDGNAWAEGFRIEVTKDLKVNPLTQVFLARGLLEMNAQFIPTNGITETPMIKMLTVSDAFGNGAAIAAFQDLALPLLLNEATNNHMGNYLFTKTDRYFFDDDEDWDWIEKKVTASTFRGGRTTPATGGTWIPFDPSLDVIVSGLALDSDYFTGIKCATIGDDCSPLLNIIFEDGDGFGNQEPNQGSDPQDWRSTATENPAYLETIYPNGTDWTDAFEFAFTPTAP